MAISIAVARVVVKPKVHVFKVNGGVGFYVYCFSGDLGNWSLKSSYGLEYGYIGFLLAVGWGVHTITFVVAISTAGRLSRRVSKTCVSISELVLLCQGATDVQCRCNGN